MNYNDNFSMCVDKHSFIKAQQLLFDNNISWFFRHYKIMEIDEFDRRKYNNKYKYIFYINHDAGCKYFYASHINNHIVVLDLTRKDKLKKLL